jgi:hypothetical protein
VGGSWHKGHREALSSADRRDSHTKRSCRDSGSSGSAEPAATVVVVVAVGENCWAVEPFEGEDRARLQPPFVVESKEVH